MNAVHGQSCFVMVDIVHDKESDVLYITFGKPAGFLTWIFL